MNLKTIMPAIALLLAFIVCASNVKAADGDYVVTLKGDTIKCKISTPAFGWGKSKYKLEGSDETVKIDIKDIKSYYVSKRNNLYRAVYHGGKDKPEFLRVVENGTISLYEIIYTHGGVNGVAMSNTEWHIGKNSDVVQPLKTNAIAMGGKSAKERREDLAEMFKDKPEVYQRYKAEEKFSFKRIQELVRWYNTGVKPENQKKDDGDN